MDESEKAARMYRRTVPWAELRERQKLKREREIAETLADPWWEDPKELARLFRYLTLCGAVPEDVADFIENARTWVRYREDMVNRVGPA